MAVSRHDLSRASPRGGAAAPQHAPVSLLVNEQPGAPEGWTSSVKLRIIPTSSRRAVPSVAGLELERWSVEKGA
jgi:hypothetical protein